MPTSLDVSPDARVIAVTAITSVGIGVVISAVAAWMVTAPALTVLMPGANRSVARSSRFGKILLGLQAALAIVLVTHASLLGRNIYNINAVESGLTSETVLIGSPFQRVGAYRDLDAAAYYRDVLARVKAVPGVASAGFSQFRPARGTVPPESVGRAGTAIGEGDVAAETTRISPGFFETLGMSIVQGRDFTFADNEHSPRVAIISRRLARQLFGEGRGVGEHVRISTRLEMQDLQVVGIVNDARLFDIRRGNLVIAYIPALQSGRLAHFKFLVVRAPASAARGIQQAIESLGAETMQRIQTLAYARGRTLLQERVLAALGGYFGFLALMLVAAGVYGLLSYVLSLRRKEIGIRMALGADGRLLGRTILADAVRVVGVGLGVGLVAALLSVRVLQNVLVATSPYDPIALASACGVLLVITVLASVAPAVRAARVNPLAELRRDS